MPMSALEIMSVPFWGLVGPVWSKKLHVCIPYCLFAARTRLGRWLHTSACAVACDRTAGVLAIKKPMCVLL